MKYITEIIVKVPRDEFISKFDNFENLQHWQQGLISAEHLSGSPGELGAKIQLNYDFGNRKMELIEIITKHNLPSDIHATYSRKGINNIQKNYFKRTSEGYTKWISENEFVPLNLQMRLLTVFMPRAFKKQSLKYMENFKNFVENGRSVKDA